MYTRLCIQDSIQATIYAIAFVFSNHHTGLCLEPKKNRKHISLLIGTECQCSTQCRRMGQGPISKYVTPLTHTHP